MTQTNEKKRHHYVPIAYMKGFVDDQSRIHAYPKDDPRKHLHIAPDQIGFERYYYSQPLPSGGRENNRLEDFFGTIEAAWPPIVDRARRRLDINPDLSAIFEFMGMMRVRVPAARDMVEIQLAESLKATGRTLDRAGRLPPKPPGLEHIWDHVDVSIDPHRSIHAMPILAVAFGQVVHQVGFRMVHNETENDFITSDNPVLYFDPDVPMDSLLPYTLDRARMRVHVLFPIDRRTIFFGTPEWRSEYSNVGVRHAVLSDRGAVRRLNTLIAKFGYRFVFSASPLKQRFIEKHAPLSPTLRVTPTTTVDGELVHFQCVFGPRPRKPKWSPPESYPTVT